MENLSEREGGSRKKPYVKPSLQQVRLKPEEAVLGGCKVGTFSGPVVNCYYNFSACSVLVS
jgi:hypothetical protein